MPDFRVSHPAAFAVLAALMATQASAQVTALSLRANPSGSRFGSSVTLIATLALTGATGKVTFYDGVTMLGVGALKDGSALMTTSQLPAGNRKLHAYYGGDATHSPVTSNTITQVVTAIPSSTFATLPKFNVGVSVQFVAAADFDGDGILDLATAEPDISILLGKGDGTYRNGAVYRGSAGLSSVAVGDFNGDGKLDLVASDAYDGTICLLMGNGDGTFQPMVSYPAAPGAFYVSVGDVNHDGKADVVALATATALVFLGNGDGTVRPPLTVAIELTATSVAIADFNRDGKADLAMADGVGALVLLGNGDGSFQAPVNVFHGITNGIAVGDFNGDGIADLAATLPFNAAVAILTGNGDGTFVSAAVHSTGSSPEGVAVAKFDASGADGLAVLNQIGNSVSVLEGTAQQIGFDYPLNEFAGGFLSVAAGDFNGDGRADLAVTNAGSGFLTVFLGTTLDLSVTGGDHQSGYLGRAFGAPLQVLAKDGSGAPVPGVVVVFGSPAPGAGAVFSPSSAVTGASGVASAGATANLVAGSYNVIAQSGTVAASFALTNVADVPVSLTAFAGSLQSTAVGMPFTGQLRVVLKDAGGVPVVGVPIAFSSPAAGASAVLSAPVAVTDDSGIAYVLATANSVPGAYTVTATAGTLVATFALTNVPRTGVTLSTSANPARFGTTVTMNVAVTPYTATGKITFYEGTSILGVRSIVSGAASLATFLLPAGDRRLKAYYSGDGNNPASESNVVIQTVTTVRGYGFTAAGTWPAGSGAMGIAVADLNGDGRLDLVVGHMYSNFISVLLADVSGFREIDYFVGSDPAGVAIGDFNGDGKPDMAAVNASQNSVAIFVGRGDGTFIAPVNYATNSAGGVPNRVAIGDFNRDGIADLAIANRNMWSAKGDISVLLGKGDATFRPAVNWSAGDNVNRLAVGDLNGDGKPDLVVSNVVSNFAGNGQAAVLLGNGDGTFQPAALYFPAGMFDVLVEDLDGDGNPDVAFPEAYGGVMRGNGNGTLQAIQHLPFNDQFLAGVGAVGDFDGDGKPDLVETGSGRDLLGLLLGKGDASFRPAVLYTVAGSPEAVAVADFNGDGRADVVVANNRTGTVTILTGSSTVLSLSSVHSGNFTFGQTGATYTVTVTNAGPTVTSGAVTVQDKVPAGLIATSISGAGWLCNFGTLACSRSDALAAGASYPPITVSVNVSMSASSPQTNAVTVTGGGAADATATDSTNIACSYGLNASALQATFAAGSGSVSISAPSVCSWTASSNSPWLTVTASGAGNGTIAYSYTANPSTVPRSGTISLGGQTFTVSQDGYFVSPALRFVPVSPCRVIDTRNAAGAFGGPQIPGGGTRNFAIPNGACGIPSTAQAYALNVAIVPMGPLGYLTVWPVGQTQPTVSTLNSLDGRMKSNGAIVPAGAGGAISIFASNATHVILDIDGYFVPAADATALAYFPVAPCRMVDTRNAGGPLGGPALGESTRSFPVLSSACGIPASARAYSLSLAAIPKGPLGYLTIWGTGQSQPQTASLNAISGAMTANAAIVPAGGGGSIDVFASNATDLVIDVTGYFAPMAAGGLSLYATAPCRVLDSRAGGGPMSGMSNLAIAGGNCGLPLSAQAYVLSAAAVPPGPLGYLTLWAQGQAQPNVSTLNAVDGAVTSNLAIVRAANGGISIFPSNPTQLVLDAFGYFAP